jgi:hypothetical protein
VLEGGRPGGRAPNAVEKSARGGFVGCPAGSYWSTTCPVEGHGPLWHVSHRATCRDLLDADGSGVVGRPTSRGRTRATSSRADVPAPASTAPRPLAPPPPRVHRPGSTAPPRAPAAGQAARIPEPDAVYRRYVYSRRHPVHVGPMRRHAPRALSGGTLALPAVAGSTIGRPTPAAGPRGRSRTRSGLSRAARRRRRGRRAPRWPCCRSRRGRGSRRPGLWGRT